ncbi:glycosyltransferase family 2 protein [Patescibacteria group bacterium]|nr:MAG: glycosyltransferase family 2 protein [Patescibacteria group bacterium]
MDLSILIVHYNTPGLLRQTLKGIRLVAPKLSYEVIVVDNNPSMRVAEAVRREFPEVRLIVPDRHLGFGGGMNRAMGEATGRYLLVFNPDIAVFSGALEELVRFMDASPEVGMCGPQLLRPDGAVQHSCFRFMAPEVIAWRRLPWLAPLFPRARRALDAYVMAEWDHTESRDVDYMLGAALCVRRTAYEQVGGFDPGFFVYFEDQDWCRRFWEAGWKVTYHPGAKLVHYHRRETAEGSLWRQLMNPLTRIQLRSALYYYKKWKGKSLRPSGPQA